MTYSSGGLIQAADYNSFATSINTIWGTGSGSSGYGQSTTLSNATAAVTIASTEWSAAVSRLNSMRAHQSGATYAPTSPTSGGLIQYLSDFSTTVTTITTNKNAFNANGSDSTTNYDNSTGWYTSSQREVSLTFASGDAARYFFNAGGQIRVSFSLTSGDNSKSTDWATLCSDAGTLVFGSNTFSKSGGGGNAPSTYNTGIGYYSLTTSYQTLSQQYSTGSAGSYYSNNYIQFQVKSNGVQGANSDKGSVITFNANFVDAATDSNWAQLYGNPDQIDEVHGTLRMAVTIRYPSSTYLSSTAWGTPTLAQVTNTATGQITTTAAATRTFVNNYTTSPWNLDTNGTFAVAGSNYFYIQPSFDFKAWVHMWGAGGGGGNYNNGYYPAGGPGGYTTGLVQFKSGYTYYIRVGQNGFGAPDRGTDVGYPGGYGGRGISGGAGGGATGIFLNVEGFGSWIMGAGGGGGGGNAYDLNNNGVRWGGGGGGGGNSGDDAGGNPFGNRATGGSQTTNGTGSTGGSGGGYNGGWNGYPQQGGASSGRGGGGGGGYYGGGGGGYYSSSWDLPGGGGSGYVNATHVSSGATYMSRGGDYAASYYRQPQGFTNANWVGDAGAGGYQATNGGGGRIVIL